MSDAALDATAEALTRRLLAEIPADRPRGSADIDRLPTALAPLVHARLAAAVETAAPTRSAWIDAETVREASEAWHAAALDAAHVPADVWPEAVREAAGLALAHLTRPADTLAAVAFAGGRASLPVAVALERVEAFRPYPYLPQIATQYAQRKELDAIDRVGLEQLLRRIDRRMVATFGPDDWTTLLGPLFDLVGPVGSPAGAVPTALLRLLFEAKGSDALAAELDGIDSITLDDLRPVLDRLLAPVAAPEPETARQPPDLSPPPLPPVVEGVHPPTIGSQYEAPEFDGMDESEVLGPPVPAGSSTATDAVEDDDAEAAPVAEPSGDASMAEPPDEARGTSPWITPAPVASVSDDAFIFPSDPPRETVASVPPTPAGAVVEDVPPEPTAAPADRGPSAPAEPAPSESDEVVPRIPEARKGVPDFDDEPLWKQLVRERQDDAPPAPAPAASSEDEEEPLWKRFAQSDLAAKLPTPPPVLSTDTDAPSSPALDALEARVLGAESRERRDWFVAELFEGSPSAYHRTLDRIDRSANYTEATGIISSDILRAHSVNPYTESMVAFIDAVQDHFDRR